MAVFVHRGSTVLIGLVLGLGLAGAALGADDIVAKREAAMKHAGGNLKAIGTAAKGGAVSPDTVAAAQDLVAFGQSIPSLFPEGSSTPKSRALPEIWSDQAGFTQKAKEFQDAVGAVLVAAQGGDAAALGKAVEAAAPTCGACHKLYRGPEKD